MNINAFGKKMGFSYSRKNKKLLMKTMTQEIFC